MRSEEKVEIASGQIPSEQWQGQFTGAYVYGEISWWDDGLKQLMEQFDLLEDPPVVMNHERWMSRIDSTCERLDLQLDTEEEQATMDHLLGYLGFESEEELHEVHCYGEEPWFGWIRLTMTDHDFKKLIADFSSNLPRLNDETKLREAKRAEKHKVPIYKWDP